MDNISEYEKIMIYKIENPMKKMDEFSCLCVNNE